MRSQLTDSGRRMPGNMIQVGQVIPCVPYEELSKGLNRRYITGYATVVYIHPLGRFYTVRFDFPKGSFCESRYFTQSELEEAWDLGIFPRRVEQLLDQPRPEREDTGKRKKEMKDVEAVYDDDDFSTILAMA